MGHYLVYVLIPPETKDIDKKVDELMALFSKKRSVPAYERPCECVVLAARSKAEKLTEEKFGPRSLECCDSVETKEQGLWTQEEKTRADFHRIQTERLIEIEPPNPDCGTCKGTGRGMTSLNPDTEWDYWDRAEGFTRGVLVESLLDIPPLIAADVSPVTNLDLGKLPLPDAIITPKGEWFTHCLYVLYDAARELDPNWDVTVNEILDEYKNCLLVAINSHL